MSELDLIFGTGPLAQSVMRALLKRGKAVRMVNRSGKRPVDVPAEVEIVSGDAYRTDFTRSVTKGAAVVYQCAQPVYQKWVTQFPSLQAAILEGAAASGAKLIVGENLSMYGDTCGQPLREDLPYAAHTRKGSVRSRLLGGKCGLLTGRPYPGLRVAGWYREAMGYRQRTVAAHSRGTSKHACNARK